MAEKSTFIKLDRNIINWRWFQNSKVLSVFLWLLIKANIKEGHFERDKIERGSLATSNAHIAECCGLTVNNVRTALANLEETGEITRNIRNHYQVITIVNYESYQSDMSKSVGRITSNLEVNSQATSMATHNNIRIKERKNERREKNKRKDSSPLEGVGDIAKADKLKPIDEGTIDDIPIEYRDFCQTYADYWRYRNR